MLPELKDDEFYHSDLIGLEAIHRDGARLGSVQAVLDYGAGDLLEVRMENSKDTVLLPFTAATVPTVDLAAGQIVIDPPDGLLPVSARIRPHERA